MDQETIHVRKLFKAIAALDEKAKKDLENDKG